MSLTVLNVAYPFSPVSPDAVGGAEQILRLLDDALVENGHHSIVIACSGSAVKGTLLELPPPPASGVITEAVRAETHARCRRLISEALGKYPVDLVHFHGVDFAACLPSEAVPVLATLHLPPAWYPGEVLNTARRDTWLVCVSAAQARACPAGAAIGAVIENGVRLDEYRCRVSRRGFVLALGRICPEKGFHLAFEAAARAGRSLILGGQVFPYEAHQRYFRESIVPWLDGNPAGDAASPSRPGTEAGAPRRDRSRGPAGRFAGPLSLRRKRRFLAAARCVVIPSLVPETSSLVAIEALASGTPVVAFPAGALPDIVEDGATGFLVNNVAEMAEAIEAAGRLDPGECRGAARERFRAERMTEQYLDLYRQVSGARTISFALDRRSAVPTVEEIGDVAGLEALRPEWHALWTRSPHVTPFQLPEWLIPWWRHFGAPANGRLCTLAVRRAGRLIALVPIYQANDPATGNRVIRPLGTGVSDYLDVLAEPGEGAAVVAGFGRWLETRKSRFDLCDWSDLPDTSPLLKFSPVGRDGATDRSPDSTALVPEWHRDNPCPILGRYEIAQLPATLEFVRRRYSLDRAERKLRRWGGAEMVVADDHAGVVDFLEILIRLHEKRWSIRRNHGVLADRAVRSFQRDVVPGFAARGVLRFYGLKHDDRIIAMFYALAHRKNLHFYLSGFDPALKVQSPGSVLFAMVLEQAARETFDEIHFLRGNERYKYLWGARDRWNYRWTVTAGGSPRDETARSVQETAGGDIDDAGNDHNPAGRDDRRPRPGFPA